jgi:hypothetical protein
MQTYHQLIVTWARRNIDLLTPLQVALSMFQPIRQMTPCALPDGPAEHAAVLLRVPGREARCASPLSFLGERLLGTNSDALRP